MKRIVYIIFPLFISSCSNISGDLVNKFQEEGSISFNLGPTITQESHTFQYIETDSVNFLAFFNHPTEEIIFYDYDNKLLKHKIKLQKEGPEGVGIPFGFHIKSLDSIFVLSSATYDLSLINYRGKVINKYSLFKGKISKYGIPEEGVYSCKPIMQSTNPLIILSDSLVALSGLPDNNPLKTNFYDSKVYMVLNLKTGNFEYEIAYPDEYKNNLWGLYHSFPFHTYNENLGKAVISFPASQNLLVTNFKQTTIKSYDDNKLEKPKPWVEPELSGMAMMKHFTSSPSYYRIIYDKDKDIYYRFCQKPTDIEYKKINIESFSPIRSKETYIDVLDNEFKKIGEFDFPKDLDPKYLFVNSKGLHILHLNKDEDILTFKIFGFRNE